MSQAHLTDLFRVGKIVDVVVDGVDDPIQIWMRKPTVEQQQQARTKGAAASARVKRRMKDKDSEYYTALWDGIEELSREEALQGIIEADRSNLSSQSYNEVLYGEDFGSDWSEEGKHYAGIVEAETVRWDEITRHNESDPEDLIDPNKDEELLKLREAHAEFDIEWNERTDQLMKKEQDKYDGASTEDLRKKLLSEAVKMESLMAFHQEYRMNMLFYACRQTENRKKLYFREKEDILELPLHIQTNLLGELDDLQAVDPKALATLRSS